MFGPLVIISVIWPQNELCDQALQAFEIIIHKNRDESPKICVGFPKYHKEGLMKNLFKLILVSSLGLLSACSIVTTPVKVATKVVTTTVETTVDVATEVVDE